MLSTQKSKKLSLPLSLCYNYNYCGWRSGVVAIQKAISELEGMSFYVPSYQRGYRWTVDEVTDFLEDIYSISSNDIKVEYNYCLQPLILKERKKDGSFEVVDGQQRLTTIFIFFQVVQKYLPLFSAPFTISYETRENSKVFLESLSENHEGIEDNIDFFHMAQAYDTIKNWLENHNIKTTVYPISNNLQCKVFFIWHVIPDNEDSITTFRKVNFGKIGLTNAELIKALLLDKENFNSEDGEKRRLEISASWDRMETSLYDPAFWYFINNNTGYKTRIDLLFNLHADLQKTSINKDDRLYSFLVFSKKLEDNKNVRQKFVQDTWQEIENTYEKIIDWYRDTDKFHIIGYLIYCGDTIDSLLSLTDGKRKSKILEDLMKQVKKKFPDIRAFDEISYELGAQKLKRIFLLFNIATLVCKSEKQQRFPFYIFKDPHEGWDIEHIHATADKTAEPDDRICNLTLLNEAINRSYKADTFDEKRKKIIQRDLNGLFIPLCTRNIFLKAYSKDPSKIQEWTDNDKKDYLQAMKETIRSFYSKGVGNNG